MTIRVLRVADDPRREQRPHGAPSPVRVLLVDDDPDTRAVVALALALHPRFTVEAVSRLDAADTLRRGRVLFDLILLDMKQSDMSASALVATMRQWMTSQGVPIVMLSAQASDADRRRYRTAGAQGVVAKPFDPVGLPDRILEMIEPPTA